MKIQQCLIDGCEKRMRVRGFCSSHYQRWWYKKNQAFWLYMGELANPEGENLRGEERRYEADRKSIEYADQFTSKRRIGLVRADGCDMEDCIRPHKANGLCNTHYQADYRRRKQWQERQ